MLPVSQHSYFNTIPNFQPLTYPDVTLLTNQSFSQPSLQSQGSSLQGSDPNSPQAFRQNIQIVQDIVMRLQNLARSALSGIEHAYHPGTNPVQTAADVTAVNQAIQILVDLLKQTGVGSLPLSPPDISDSTVDERMLSDATRSIQILYNRSRRMQESASVVANLLGAVDQAAKK